MRKFMACVVALVTAAVANADPVYLAGTATDNIQSALNALGVTYTNLGTGNTVDPSTLAAGSILILSNDGGTGPLYDYNSFLNNGGRIIAFGGSNYQPYRDWADDYFNITDTGSGWHTDGAFHLTGPHPATTFVPANYAFEDNNVSFHMLSFLPTPDTTLLATNDEPNFIAAFRTYSNGGWFNYLALDPGPYGTTGDLNNFTIPYLRSALNTNLNAVPEPLSLLVFGGLLAGGGLAARRRMKKAAA